MRPPMFGTRPVLPGTSRSWPWPSAGSAREEAAQALLARLREVMKVPAWASRADLQTYVRKAEKLIGGKAPDPKP